MEEVLGPRKTRADGSGIAGHHTVRSSRECILLVKKDRDFFLMCGRDQRTTDESAGSDDHVRFLLADDLSAHLSSRKKFPYGFDRFLTRLHRKLGGADDFKRISHRRNDLRLESFFRTTEKHFRRRILLFQFVCDRYCRMDMSARTAACQNNFHNLHHQFYCFSLSSRSGYRKDHAYRDHEEEVSRTAVTEKRQRNARRRDRARRNTDIQERL